MKKWMVTTLLVALVLLLVSPAIPAEKVVLEWVTCCAQPERWEAFQTIANRYMETHPNVEIQWSYPGATYHDTLKTRYAAGEGPDIAWNGTDILHYHQLVLPLNDLVAKSKDVAEINPVILKWAQFEGMQVGLPYGATSSAFFYNKDIFDKFGYEYPTRDWTFDTVIAAARRMTVANPDGTIAQYGVGQMHREWDRWWAMTWGGDFYTPDGRRTAVNNPVSIAALQWYADHWNSKFVPFTGPGNTDQTMFNGGVAMNAINIIELAKMKANTSINWDVQIMPAFVHDGQYYRNAQVTIETWMISRNTKYPQEAKEFVAYLFSEEAMRIIAQAGFIIPSQTRAAVNFYSVEPPPANLGAFFEGVNYAKADHRLHPASAEINSYINPLISDIFNLVAPARQIVPEMEKGVNTILDEYFSRR
ncbi:MAG TPA: sugar ABC transporter substrate-binding protein [Firmicutes bacterium]|nr:sugar ABC transporter substrate-binding protein [Bacillota bacterium]